MSPTVSNHCYYGKFGRSRSNGWCIITEILQRSFALPVSPFTITEGHWNQHRSIDHPWLLISVL